MPSTLHILCVPSALDTSVAAKSDVTKASEQLEDFVLRDTFRTEKGLSVAEDDHAALVSKLNSIGTQYTHYLRSVAPCAFASPVDPAPHSPGLNRDDEGRKNRRNAQTSVAVDGEGNVSGASCVPPDLESFWPLTSPLPPTAVLTALYSLLPLRRVSAMRSRSGKDAKEDDRSEDSDSQTTVSIDLLWSLSRAGRAGENEPLHFSSWEAYAMMAMAAHSSATQVTYGGSTGPSQGTTSSASSFSLSQQLRRATAALTSLQHSVSAASAATLLEWPEEFLWNLLMSLLSALALTHNAGLHFYGQLTAANILCFSCAASMPRVLEQTYQDIAATTSRNGVVEGNGMDDRTAVFRHFYAMASKAVLLPQAAVTSETPCYSVHFVVEPSVALISKQHKCEAADSIQQDRDEADKEVSIAQEFAWETPEQQARFQAADLASVGQLLTTIMDLRAQWSSAGGHRSVPTTEGAATPATPAAHPSSELIFLVRRLCECSAAATSDVATTAPVRRSCPTAVQLLQLQALRLRTEAWYYRRLASEAFDRISHLQQSAQAAAATAASNLQISGGDRIAETKQAPVEAAETLKAREAAVAEREAKLDLILRVYELTHEHLDAVPLPASQTPSSQQSHSAPHRAPEAGAAATQSNNSPQQSPGLREDSLEALLSAPVYRQAATTTAPSQTDAAPLRAARHAPITNVSHQQHKAAVAAPAAAADTSADALLGLSPLPRVPELDNAKQALLSSKTSPLPSSAIAGQSENLPEAPAMMWSGSATTRRALNVGVATTAFPDTDAGVRQTLPKSLSTTYWPDTNTQNALQGTAAATSAAIAKVGARDRVPDGLQPMPWNPSQQQQQQQQQRAQQPNDQGHVPHAQTYATSLSSSHQATASPPITVVEVELDDDDDEDGKHTRAATRYSAPMPLPVADSAAQMWMNYHAAQPDVQFGSAAAVTRAAQEMRTPVRAPALPNMGAADVDLYRTSPGAAATAGGMASHSKYSSLAQLRTPPSARRLNAAAHRTEASPSPSPHSPESYRSSTKPYSMAAPVHAMEAAEKAVARPRSARRRSASRGSSGGGGGNNTGNRQHSADGLSAKAGPDASSSVPGTAPTSSGDGGSSNENGEWARQQLTELQNMQTALRAQQPATPRSRASASAPPPPAAPAAATAAVVEGGMRTPEMRRARSPALASSSLTSTSPSPPLRAEQPPVAESAAAPDSTHRTPPSSPSLLQTTPTRPTSATDERSLLLRLRSNSSHRSPPVAPPSRDAGLYPSSHQLYASKGAEVEDGPPVQVQGAAWPAAASGTMQTPPSHRQRHNVAWSAPAASASPEVRPTPVLTGRTSPLAKSTGPHVRSSPAVAGERGRAPYDARGITPTHPSDFGAGGVPPTSATPATSATAAALGAALRTPPRQTVPTASTTATTATSGTSESHRLINLFYPAGTVQGTPHAPSTHSALDSTRRVASTTPLANSARTRGSSAKEGSSGGAHLRSSSRLSSTTALAAATATAEIKVPSSGAAARVGVLSPRRTNNSARGGGGGQISNNKNNHTDSNGGPTLKAAGGASTLRRSGADAHLSSAVPHVHSQTSASAGNKASAQPRGAAPSTSAMELLRRLRASSTATA